VLGVALGAQGWFWIEADPVWLYGFATHFFGTTNIPQVVSISYGWNEEDQCENGMLSFACGFCFVVAFVFVCLLLLVCCLFSLSSSFALTLRNWFL
jgi:hypothetical protein